MNISFTENGWKDYLDWQKNDKNLSSQAIARVFSANFADDCVKIP